MGYVETMFGHQSEINAIDSWRKERVVTGGRDRTVSLNTAFCWCMVSPSIKSRAGPSATLLNEKTVSVLHACLGVHFATAVSLA